MGAGSIPSNDPTPGTPPGVDRLTTGERAVKLAVDDQRLYWLSQIYAANPGYDQIAVRSMPRAGGAPATMALVDGGGGRFFADVDALYVYATTCSRDPANPYPCNVNIGGGARAGYRVPKAGGAVTTVDGGKFPLAADAANLYVTKEFPGGMEIAPKDGSPSRPFSDSYGFSMVLTSSDTYWYDLKGLHHRAAGAGATDDLGDFWLSGELKLDGDTLLVHGGLWRGSYPPTSYEYGLYAMPRSGVTTPRLLRGTPTYNSSIETGGGRVFWHQDPLPLDGFLGCAAASNTDGSAGRCIDRGLYHYGDVQLSGSDFFYLRNGDVFRASSAASEDPDASDGEWTESGVGVPAGAGAASGAAVLVSGEQITSLAIDSDNVYWTTGSVNRRSGDLRAISKAGGAPLTVAHTPGSGFDLDASSGWLFWNYQSEDPLSWSGIRRLSKQGGSIGWLGYVSKFVVDGNWIYFQNSDGAIGRADLAGRGRTSTGVSQPPILLGRFTASNGELIWMDAGEDNGGVSRIATAVPQGPIRTLATTAGFKGVDRIVADAANVYWIQNSNLFRVPRAGGATTSLGSARDVDAGGRRVYWAEPNWNFDGSYHSGCIYGADPDGGNKVCLDTANEALGPVRADDRSVFFVRGGNSVVRVNQR